ncbi:MAG: hypothetical protein ACYTFT_00570 [Planctomycetota bacterium]
MRLRLLPLPLDPGALVLVLEFLLGASVGLLDGRVLRLFDLAQPTPRRRELLPGANIVLATQLLDHGLGRQQKRDRAGATADTPPLLRRGGGQGKALGADGVHGSSV